MDAKDLLLDALVAAIVGYGFATGLATTPRALTSLLREPGLAARTALALFVAGPLLAIALYLTLPMPRAVALALALLAVSPGLPLLPVKSARFGGRADYAVSVTFLSGLAAIVVAPAFLEALSAALGRPIEVSPLPVAASIAKMILAPLAVGALARAVAPGASERASSVLTRVVNVVWPVLALIFAVLVAPALLAIGAAPLGLMLAVAVVLVAIGHLLGGPEEGTRLVLALATANRFPGLAIALAAVHLPGDRAVVAAILAYTVLSSVVASLYGVWRRSAAHTPAEPA